MFCTNCGNPVLEGAKFCTNCGAPVVASRGAAPNRDMQPEAPNAVMQEPPATMAPPASTQTEQTEERKTTQPGESVSKVELGKFKWMSKYIGTPVVGNSVASGTLYVYADGLKFDPQWGSSLHGSGGLVGAIAAATVDLIDSGIDNGVYHLKQIVELRTGKYMGIYNTLVVSLKNGDVWSFAPALPGSKVPEQIISLLKPYMENSGFAQNCPQAPKHS